MGKVIIAGGGIAGLAAALALSRAGWRVTLCERAPEFGEVGAGIQLGPNACRVLAWLGVLQGVNAHAFSPVVADMRDGETGEQLLSLPLGAAAEQRWGAPYLHVHRADLVDALSIAVAVEDIDTRMNCEAVCAETGPDGATLFLSNGDTLRADLVIGADGIHSVLREAVAPGVAPRFTGQTAWRALIPVAAVPEGLIRRAATVWAGAGRHLVTYYVRGGDLINVVAVIERPDWTEEGWSVPGDPAELYADFAGWAPPVARLLDQVTECFLWGLFDRPADAAWTTGRIALIGDAAHPMLPFMAQGAAMALEDVPVLVNALAIASDIPAALTAYETARRPRVIRVVARAAANGRLFHHPPGLARWLARTPIRMADMFAPGLAAGQLDWLYGYDATDV